MYIKNTKPEKSLIAFLDEAFHYKLIQFHL